MTMTKLEVLEKSIEELKNGDDYTRQQLAKKLEQEVILTTYESNATKPNERQLLNKVTKWMQKEYKKHPNKILTTCHYMDKRQMVTNGYIMVFFNNNLPLPYDENNILSQESIKKIYDPVYNNNKDIFYTITTQSIKAAKALKIEYIKINNTVLSIEQLEPIINFTGDITVYVGENALNPIYFYGELIDGIICPCRAAADAVTKKLEELKAA